MPFRPIQRPVIRANNNRFFSGRWLSIIFAIWVLAGLNSLSAQEGFQNDFEAAAKQAARENKDIMLLFTGSDWCPPCKKLESEVFAEQEFLPAVADKYVLVKIDFPRSKPLPAELQQQNDQLAEKFGVEGFPTVIMVDRQLKPFAFAGYQEGGVDNFVNVMNQAHDRRVLRDQKLADAAKQTGAEKAKSLDAAIDGIGEEIVAVYYTDIVDQIVELDANNELGLRQKWNASADAEMRRIVLSDLLVMSRIARPEQTIEFIDEVLAEFDFPDAQKLNILQIKLNLAREVEQVSLASAILDQMISLGGVQGSTRMRLMAKKAYLLVSDGQIEAAIERLDREIAVAKTDASEAVGYLYLAKGELLGQQERWNQAITTLEAGIATTRRNYDLLIDLVGVKSDALFAAQQPAKALRLLDDFAENENLPEDLRAESLLQKSILMRRLGRTRQARLVENRAVDLVKSPTEKAVVQKMVQRLRDKFE